MSQQVSKRVEVLQTAPAASDLALYREPITNPVAAYLAQLSPGPLGPRRRSLNR